jgi:hypothetical protein
MGHDADLRLLNGDKLTAKEREPGHFFLLRPASAIPVMGRIKTSEVFIRLFGQRNRSQRLPKFIPCHLKAGRE